MEGEGGPEWGRKRARDESAGAAPSAAAPGSSSSSSSSSAPPGPYRVRVDVSQREAFAARAVDSPTRAAVQQLVLELVFGPGAAQGQARRFLGERPELPGPLPVSLSRRALAAQLAAHVYMVCEKSDGERAFLLAVGRQPRRGVAPLSCFLVDRAFAVTSLGTRAAEYAAFLSPGGGATLLDGELILRRDDAGTGTGARAVFMVFDVACADGRDLAGGGAPLEERLRFVRDGVRAPFSAADGRCLSEGRQLLPLYLCGKHMVDKRLLRSVLDFVVRPAGAGAGAAHAHAGAGAAPLMAPVESEAGGAAGGAGAGAATLRIYRHDIRVNGTDGLIFTPAAPSFRQLFDKDAAAPLLKWKYADEITIDFELRRESLQGAAHEGSGRGRDGGGGGGGKGGGGGPAALLRLELFVAGVDRPLAHCDLSAAQCSAYDALAARLGEEALIVECAFDAAASAWEIRRVRDRKKRANYITTAWATLESVAENITAEELCARLGAGGGSGANVVAIAAAPR